MVNRNITEYVEDLFRGYEDTPALQDFKEEIVSNLQERIEDLQKSGLNEEDSFTTAITELGDITSIANQISQQKRNEIIERMYIHTGPKLGLKHVLGYIAAGALALFGILTAFITYFVTGSIFMGVSTLVPLFIPACAAFVFLGLTQETARNLPMSWQRALVYALSTALIIFGLVTAAITYFMEERGLEAVLGTLIPFFLPGGCIIAFLLLTEQKRLKPWALEEEKMLMEFYTPKYQDPQRVHQRGLLSGALWISTIALFLVLGFLISFKYSWIIFLFAIAAEIMIEFWAHRAPKRS